MIESYAFSSCRNLTQINIPSSVVTIEFFAFLNCSLLNSFTVASTNQQYMSDSKGVLYNKNQSELIQYPSSKTETEYTLPNTVKTIKIGG